MRWPGVEPGSTAWKATMLTVTPPTLAYVKNNKSTLTTSGIFWRRREVFLPPYSVNKYGRWKCWENASGMRLTWIDLLGTVKRSSVISLLNFLIDSSSGTCFKELAWGWKTGDLGRGSGFDLKGKDSFLGIASLLILFLLDESKITIGSLFVPILANKH